ncbi:uncharacterized protein LOC128889604 [Hylaeus anthracinus]|uniref:uncharacterized protein LOC128889604 n=1 Tax=Hylaeus anthracinus TaxID=313031 RepID=UPI0023BA0387|nr:uncharacterized protein LOC128889604 [Hylaeus anthracinus]
MPSWRIIQLLRRLERRMAIRVIRGYRTISYVAAQALAGEIPFELQAATHVLVYACVQATRLVRRTPPEPESETVEEFERQAWRLALANWRLELSSHAGERVAGALLPHLKKWRERREGSGGSPPPLASGEEEDSAQHSWRNAPPFQRSVESYGPKSGITSRSQQ